MGEKPVAYDLEAETGCGWQLCCADSYVYAHEGCTAGCCLMSYFGLSCCYVACIWKPEPQPNGKTPPTFCERLCCPGVIYYHERNQCNEKVLLHCCCPCYGWCCYTPTWVEEQRRQVEHGGSKPTKPPKPPTMQRGDFQQGGASSQTSDQAQTQQASVPQVPDIPVAQVVDVIDVGMVQPKVAKAEVTQSTTVGEKQEYGSTSTQAINQPVKPRKPSILRQTQVTKL